MQPTNQSNVVNLKDAYPRPKNLKSGGGGGTFDDMEHRVSTLEGDVKTVKSDLSAIRESLAEIKGRLASFNPSDIAEIKGKLSGLPTWWGLMLGMVATWGAGAGIVYAIVSAVRTAPK